MGPRDVRRPRGDDGQRCGHPSGSASIGRKRHGRQRATDRVGQRINDADGKPGTDVVDSRSTSRGAPGREQDYRGSGDISCQQRGVRPVVHTDYHHDDRLRPVAEAALDHDDEEHQTDDPARPGNNDEHAHHADHSENHHAGIHADHHDTNVRPDRSLDDFGIHDDIDTAGADHRATVDDGRKPGTGHRAAADDGAKPSADRCATADSERRPVNDGRAVDDRADADDEPKHLPDGALNRAEDGVGNRRLRIAVGGCAANRGHSGVWRGVNAWASRRIPVVARPLRLPVPVGDPWGGGKGLHGWPLGW